MRKVQYLCDGCKEDLGDKPHIHIKRVDIAIAHKSIGEVWRDKNVRAGGCNEYQFCDVKCLVKFLKPKVDKIFDEITANPTA